jgi:carbonic anhydrase
MAYFCGSWISQIPLAVLAGIILSISIRMMDPREMIQLWKVSRIEASVYLITFLVIVFVGLISGIQAGIIAALLISLVRLSQPNANLETFESVGASRLSFDGPVTFLSSAKIEEIRNKLAKLDLARGLIVDLSQVKSMDATGARQLIELLEPLVKSKKQFVLLGVSQVHRKLLLTYDSQGITTERIASSESDIVTMLNGGEPVESLDRLLYGVEKFRKDMSDRYSSLFESLAESQSPHTLFITCSDSRIDTGLITSTHPGELFIVRNVGNIIPIFGGDNMPAEGAAVEFAISVLGVKDIIVCGHSGCGAMKAIQSGAIFTPEQSKKLPSLARWLEQARDLKKLLSPQPSLKQITEHNAVLQLENLKTYPQIIEKLKTGEIGLHAWYYDIGEAEIEEWDESQQLFVTVGSKASQHLRNRIEAGVQFQVPFDRKKK